jgi:hypothetical protein
MRLRGRIVPPSVPSSFAFVDDPKSRRLADTPNDPSTRECATTATASAVPPMLCEWWIAAVVPRMRASPDGFHQTDSVVPSSAMVACPRATARAPVGRRRSSAPSPVVGR